MIRVQIFFHFNKKLKVDIKYINIENTYKRNNKSIRLVITISIFCAIHSRLTEVMVFCTI